MSLFAQIILGLIEWGVVKGGDMIPVWLKEWQTLRAQERALDSENTDLKKVQNEGDAQKAVDEIVSDINTESK